MSTQSPVENPWSSSAGTFPFIREHIKKCNANNIRVSVAILIAVPIFVFFFGIPFLKSNTSLRLLICVICLVIGLPIYAIWNLIRSLNWQSNPQAHPALQWAELGAPFQVADHIDREIGNKEQHIRIGPALFTPSWLLRYGAWGVETVLLANVVWVYKKVTTNKTYGITTSKTYELQIFAQNGKGLLVQNVKEAQVDEILRLMEVRTPWALIGFSPELEKAWKSNRAEVLQAVAKRRADHEAAQKMATTGQAETVPQTASPLPFDLPLHDAPEPAR